MPKTHAVSFNQSARGMAFAQTKCAFCEFTTSAVIACGEKVENVVLRVAFRMEDHEAAIHPSRIYE